MHVDTFPRLYRIAILLLCTHTTSGIGHYHKTPWCLILSTEGPYSCVNCPQYTWAKSTCIARSRDSYRRLTERPCDCRDSQSWQSRDLKPRPTSWHHKLLKGPKDAGAKRLNIYKYWLCIKSIQFYLIDLVGIL